MRNNNHFFRENIMSRALKCLGYARIHNLFLKPGNVRCMSVTKELIKQNPVPVTQHADILTSNLKSAVSTTNILDIVNSQHGIMNNKHLMQALRSLFTLQKHGNSNLTTQEILKHPDFEKICQKLKQQAGSIECNELVEALKVITYVGVPSDSTIYQVLLQVIRHNINHFTLPHLMFLCFLLNRAKSGPLVDALQIAVPLVFEIQLPTKMDRQNLAHITEYLYFVSRASVSEECVNSILSALLHYRGDYDSKSAMSIVWSLCDMKTYNDLCEPVLKRALDAIIIDSFKLDYQEMETAMTKLIYRYSTRTPYFYSDVFFDICADYVIDKDLGFESAVHMLRRFLKIDYMHKRLLDYIVDMCTRNNNLIIHGDPLHVSVITCGIALSRYKPKNYEAFKKMMLKMDNFDNFDVNSSLVKLSAALCVLEIYLPKLLEKSMNTQYLTRVLKRSLVSDAVNILLITQTIKTLKPEFTKYIPSDNFSKSIMSRIRSVTEFPLQGALLHAFGSEKFVITSLFSKLGHHLDHIIVLNRDGSAVPINELSDIQTVEDLDVSSESQIVVILALNHWHYTINTKEMKGTTMLMIKTLEAKGYTVAAICMDAWRALEDFEKIPYVMQEIQSKIGDSICLSNYVR